jgi:hypothetical protein
MQAGTLLEVLEDVLSRDLISLAEDAGSLYFLFLVQQIPPSLASVPEGA